MDELKLSLIVISGAGLALIGIGVLFFYYAALRAFCEFYSKK